MAKNDGKSKAEIYREERKDRIAKANKKNAKSIETGKTVGNIIKKTVAIVVVAAIVIGIGYVVIDNTGLVKRNVSAVKFSDGTKISATMFNYYYSSLYSQTNYYAQAMAQYGYGTGGYDTSLSPDQQTTTDEDGNEITYAEYFRTAAIDRAQYFEAFAKEAEKEGFELDEDAKAEIDETIESYRSNASEGGYSMNAYLKANFGPGVTEKKFRAEIEKSEIASKFSEYMQKKLADDISDDEIKAEYEKNQKLYDYVDVRYYIFSTDILEADEGETDEQLKTRQDAANEVIYDEAEAVSDKVTSLDSLEEALEEYIDSKKEPEEETAETAEAAEETEEAAEEEEEEKLYSTEVKHATYESINSSMNDAAADWLFDSARKAGDKSVFTNENSAYLVYVVKPAYTSHSVDVRHLLVAFSDDSEEEVTDEMKAEAYETAQGYLAEWKNGDATEESFAALVTEHSDDEGSVETGGLYEGMRITDSYVEEFLNWSFDPARKVGDVEIIETTYGYHIMYFSADNADDFDWQATIRSDKGSEAYEKYEADLISDEGEYAPEVSEYWTKRVMDEFCKKISRNLAMSA